MNSAFGSITRLCFPLWIGGILALNAPTAFAHKPSDSYLTLRVTSIGLEGEWHLSLRDLEDAVGLDLDDDGAITWDELSGRQQAIVAYAFSRLHLSADDQERPLNFKQLLVDNHSDGAYAVLRFAAVNWKPASRLDITYRALFDIDPLHRGLLRIEEHGSTRLAVLGPETPRQEFDLGKSARFAAWLTFVNEGVWHIWSGYDHILFLLALLLPGVLRRQAGNWEPVQSPKAALANVFKIVTAFTVAHSITLSLAALGLVHLPSRFVESAIAASVVLAALNNLLPFFSDRGWLVAFGFGLLHGFGFANALRDLGLHHGQLAATLFGFNIGVELGQMAIVGIFLPIALGTRRFLSYQRFVLRFGSAAIVCVATLWFAERLLDLRWLPF